MNDLSFAGLTDNETTIYKWLLGQPNSSATAIKQGTKLANSRVYDSLITLIEKGLVKYIVAARGKRFTAEKPIILRQIMKQRKEKIEQLIPQLRSLEKKEEDPTAFGISEGLQGFKNSFVELIDRCPREGTIYIVGFSKQAYRSQQLRSIINKANQVSIKKKHKLKILLDKVDNMFVSDRMKDGITDIRIMPEGFQSPAAIDIIDDAVYIFLWDETQYTFFIKNKNIAQSFKTYFSFLWNMATPLSALNQQ